MPGQMNVGSRERPWNIVPPDCVEEVCGPEPNSVEQPCFGDTLESINKVLYYLYHNNTDDFLVSVATIQHEYGYPLETVDCTALRKKKKRWWEREKASDFNQMYLSFYTPLKIIRLNRVNCYHWQLELQLLNGNYFTCHLDTRLGLTDSNGCAIKAIRIHKREPINILQAVKKASKAFEKFSNYYREMYSLDGVDTWRTSS